MTYSFKKACAFSLVAFLAFGQAMASDEKEALRAEASSSSPSSSSGPSIVIPAGVGGSFCEEVIENAQKGKPRLLDFDKITEVSRLAVLLGKSCLDAQYSFIEAALRQDVKDGTYLACKSAVLLQKALDQIASVEERQFTLTCAHSLCIKGSDDFEGIFTLLQAVVRVPASLGLIGGVPHRLPIVLTLLSTAEADNSYMSAKDQYLARAQALVQLSGTTQKKFREATFNLIYNDLTAPKPAAPAAGKPAPSSSSSSTLPPVSSDVSTQETEKKDSE